MMALLAASPPRTLTDLVSVSTSIAQGWSGDPARLRAVPRVELGQWPTLIDAWSDPVVGTLLIKRDDLSGWGRAGAKTRKIEHLVGHLLTNGCDELITVAGNVSNLVFDMLPALDRYGIESTVFIQNDPPTPAAERERIFAGVRGRVRLLGTSHTETLKRAVAAYLRSRARGRRPFLLLPGVSHPSGVIGNACGFLEMVAQRLDASEALPQTVYVSAATGTTLAGFLLAESALRQAGCDPIRVVGVQVYPGALKARTLGLIRWAERFARLSGRVSPQRIEILTSELHGGFGHFPERIAAVCGRVATAGGPRMDPIFGGKTWAAMQHDLRTVTAHDRPALYWHCGFTPEWRTLGDAVRRGGRPS